MMQCAHCGKEYDSVERYSTADIAVLCDDCNDIWRSCLTKNQAEMIIEYIFETVHSGERAERSDYYRLAVVAAAIASINGSPYNAFRNDVDELANALRECPFSESIKSATYGKLIDEYKDLMADEPPSDYVSMCHFGHSVGFDRKSERTMYDRSLTRLKNIADREPGEDQEIRKIALAYIDAKHKMKRKMEKQAKKEQIKAMEMAAALAVIKEKNKA